MQKILKGSNLKILITVLLIVTVTTLFHNKTKELSKDIKISEGTLNVVSLDLQSFIIYNNPDISLLEDYKNLFDGKYSHSVYSLHKFNLLISFLFLVMPILLIVFIFLFLGVSVRTTFFVTLFFILFTIFPVLIF